MIYAAFYPGKGRFLKREEGYFRFRLWWFYLGWMDSNKASEMLKDKFKKDVEPMIMNSKYLDGDVNEIKRFRNK